MIQRLLLTTWVSLEKNITYNLKRKASHQLFTLIFYHRYCVHDESQIMLKHVFKYTLKVFGFSTIQFQQMNCIIKLQLQSDASAIKAIICWTMQSASAKNVIPIPNVIFAQLNKHSAQWNCWQSSRCLCSYVFSYYFISIKYSLLVAWRNYFMHQKYQDVSEVGLCTSWVTQFKIFLGFQ